MCWQLRVRAVPWDDRSDDQQHSNGGDPAQPKQRPPHLSGTQSFDPVLQWKRKNKNGLHSSFFYHYKESLVAFTPKSYWDFRARVFHRGLLSEVNVASDGELCLFLFHFLKNISKFQSFFFFLVWKIKRGRGQQQNAHGSRMNIAVLFSIKPIMCQWFHRYNFSPLLLQLKQKIQRSHWMGKNAELWKLHLHFIKLDVNLSVQDCGLINSRVAAHSYRKILSCCLIVTWNCPFVCQHAL